MLIIVQSSILRTMFHVAKFRIPYFIFKIFSVNESFHLISENLELGRFRNGGKKA